MAAPPPLDAPPVPAAPTGATLRLAVWATVAAFGTYFCMYAFRKPFTAAAYDGPGAAGVDLKTLLVTAQVAGYMLSKFLGIKVVSELPPARRAAGILVLVACAELALVGFALTPAPWGAVFLFLNGLPLGMVFGLVLGFLEGRRQTEALAAGLCASFILADGVMKTVGGTLLARGVGEFWMPAAAGACFLPPLGLFVAMLARVAPPGAADVAARSERTILNGDDRRALFRRYAAGLVLLILAYLLVTVLRSVRADFAPEIWAGLGADVDASVFTVSETWVALGVLAVNGSLIAVRDNRRAFFGALGLCLGGFVILLAAVAGLRAGLFGPLAFMILAGLGLYFPYVAVHASVFERLLAMTRDRGTSGYLLYLADAYGYLGYVAVLFGRGLLARREGFADFFLTLCVACGVACVLLVAGCWRYFRTRTAVPERTAA